MRALYAGGGKPELRNVPEPDIEHPTDAIVAPIAVALGGLDVPNVGNLIPVKAPYAVGREFVGRVVEVGLAMQRLKVGLAIVLTKIWVQLVEEVALMTIREVEARLRWNSMLALRVVATRLALSLMIGEIWRSQEARLAALSRRQLVMRQCRAGKVSSVGHEVATADSSVPTSGAFRSAS